MFLFGGRKYKITENITKRNISDSFNQPIRTFTSCLRYSFSPPLRQKFCSFNRMLCHTGRKLGGYFLRGEWSSVLELLYIRAEGNLKDQSLLLLVRNRETWYLFVFSTIILMPYNTCEGLKYSDMDPWSLSKSVAKLWSYAKNFHRQGNGYTCLNANLQCDWKN